MSGYKNSITDINGKVGIGTASPAFKLDVNSGSDNNIAQFSSTDGLAYISFKDNSTTSDTSVALGADGDEMTFYTGTSFGTERMRIDSIGRVGIGELNPGYRLDVHTGAIGGIARFSGDGSNDMIFKSESGFMSIDTRNTSTGLAFQIQGSEKVRILTNGNVGIGVTNPSTPLQVNGVAQIVTGIDTAFYEGDGVRMFGTQWYRFRNSGGNVRALISVNTGNLSLYNSSNVLTNLIATDGNSYFNGGNVGIGTTSPAANLEVVDPVSGNFSGEIRIGGIGSSRRLLLRQDSATEYTIGASGENALLKFGTGTGAVERMRIDSSGNTTFTSTSPELTIKSSNGAVASGTSIGKLAWFTSDPTTPTGAGNVTTMETKSTTGNGSDYAFIINKREGSGGGSCYMNLGGNSDGSISFGTNTSGAGTERMRINSGGDISFRDTSANEAFYWDASSGHLGINVNNPVEHLDVGGVMRAFGYESRSGTNGITQYTGDFFNIFWTGSSAQLYIDTASVGTITLTSDYRVKKNIETQNASAIERINALRPVKYEYADYENIFVADNIQREGFIAHEVAQIIPSAVEGEKDAENAFQSLKLDAMLSVAVKAIQEQQEIINDLKARIETLENQ